MTDLPTAAAPESLLASPDQVSQDVITQEIRDLHADYERREAAGEWLPATMWDFPPYRSSILRHPTKNPRLVDPETIEITSPAFGQRDVAAIESNLTIQHAGEPLGERMTVQRASAGLLGAPDPEPADRTLAGELRRTLHPPARPASCPSRPELHRRRPRDHERRRRIPVHDDQARARTRGRTT